MTAIPDKVIEQAREAGWAAYSAARVAERAAGLDRVYDRANSAVIAAWARQQERNRIRRQIAAESGQARKNYLADPQAYFRGVEDGMENLLAALDRDGSDTREGEQ